MRNWRLTAAIILLATGAGACGSGGENGGGGVTGPSVIRTEFQGPFSGELVMATTTAGTTCRSTRAISGTLNMQIEEPGAAWTATTSGTYRETAVTQSSLCSPLQNPNVPFDWNPTVTASGSSLSFMQQRTSSSTTPATVTVTTTLSFTGTRTGDTITGTLTYTDTSTGQSANGNSISGNGATTMTVTLQKR